MSIQLQDIFTTLSNKQQYTLPELFTLKLSPSFIQLMSIKLDLAYVGEEEQEGNLCFANHSAMRPEFRLSFSKMDIIHYIKALIPKDYIEIKADKIPFPTSDLKFWETIKNTTK